MKGCIPIEIPTKSYIRAYIIAQLGEKPLMNTSHNIGLKMYDLLHHKTNEQDKKFTAENTRYNAKIKIYINYSLFKQRGFILNSTHTKNFNLFVEEEVKTRFHFLMDFFCEILPSFEANLPEVRRKLGIDLEAWPDDSMKKDYYRYRLRTRKEIFYKK